MSFVDLILILIVIVVMLAIIGFVIYFATDYFKFKKTVDTEITAADKAIVTETSNRLSNLKYVVDQVNTVNADISNTFTSNMNKMNNRVGLVENKNTAILGSMNKSFGFTSNLNGTGVSIDFLNLPSSPVPNMNLLSHVTMMSGMNINGLNNAADPNHSMNLCFDANNCIQLPNATGNTFFTAQANKLVEMGADVQFDKTAKYMNGFGNVGGQIYGLNNGVDKLSDVPSLRLNSRRIGLGTGPTEIVPSAGVHITQSAPGDDILRVSRIAGATGNTNPLVINKDGNVTGRTTMFAESYAKTFHVLNANNVSVAQINETSGGGITIKPAPGKAVTIDGDLNYTGKLKHNGNIVLVK